MIHAICDFCGHDADRTALLLTVTPFQNFARYPVDHDPYGSKGPEKSYCICNDCYQKMGLPNPYHDYRKMAEQKMEYKKHFGNYSESDFSEDARRDHADGYPAMGWKEPQAKPDEKGDSNE